MLHIVWKNFKSNIKNFLAFFTSVIMAVSSLFLFMYFQQATASIGKEKVSVFSHVNTSQLSTVILTFVPQVTVIAIIVVVYSVQFYIKSRLKDYGMLIMLGIREKDMKKFLALEYMMSCVFACMAGLIFGNIVTFFLGKGLRRYLGASFQDTVNMSKVYKMTLFMCVLMIVLSLLGIAIFLEEKGVTEIINGDVKKERRFSSKWSLLCLGISVVLCALGVAIESKSIAMEKIAEWIMCAGIIVGIGFGTGYLMERYRLSNNYWKKLLVWNQFYHYFNKNKFMVLVQVLIGVIFLNFTFNSISMTLPLERSNYPNDFVGATKIESGFLEEFQQRYGGDNIVFTFAWAETLMGEPRIGMSLSDYNRIFDCEETLEENEVISLRSHEEMWSLIENEERQESDSLHLGKYCGGKVSQTNGKHYKVKEEKTEDVLGFHIGGIVVFNDDTFRQAIEKEKFYQNFFILNVDKTQLDEATIFVEGEAEKGVLQEAICRKNVEENEWRDKILMLVLTIVLDFALLFLAIFVLWLKTYAESSKMKEKYQFLSICGMKEKEQGRTLRGEIGLGIKIPMILTPIFVILYNTAWIVRENKGIGNMYFRELCVIIMVYILLQSLFMTTIRVWAKKTILCRKKSA